MDSTSSAPRTARPVPGSNNDVLPTVLGAGNANRRQTGDSGPSRSFTHDLPRNGRNLSDSHSRDHELETCSNLAVRTASSAWVAGLARSTSSNYAEVSSVPEFGIYRDERPLPGRPAAFPLSDGVTRPDLRAQSFPAFRFPLWANAEQQRRSHEFLNPPSTFQANLDAVSPESQGLFLQCNPDQPDEDAGEDPRDPYWTWSRDRQQWFHIDKERGVVVWCPEEFD